ncbi:hypothetical protein TNCT_32571 [Trichonephila clavata]|uniref:Uncharacterized protein n=1 Tax=Trichonephila clavata TaxID=2740835 RepID=A0A8X6HYS3_TRICU|nr:hypothetical protein TNCT_32571 [Trichonephila clavata]
MQVLTHHAPPGQNPPSVPRWGQHVHSIRPRRSLWPGRIQNRTQYPEPGILLQWMMGWSPFSTSSAGALIVSLTPPDALLVIQGVKYESFYCIFIGPYRFICDVIE